MTGPRFAVVCRDYIRRGFATRESAQRALDEIVRLDACHHEHRVVETSEDAIR